LVSGFGLELKLCDIKFLNFGQQQPEVIFQLFPSKLCPTLCVKLHADASGGQPVLSIIDVCAANLIGQNLVREMGLLLMPYTNWTRCGDWPAVLLFWPPRHSRPPNNQLFRPLALKNYIF
jgi:hypothetical protein